MRLRSILSEAMRNVGAGNAHALALFVAVLLGGMLLGGYEAYTVVVMEHEAMARVQAMADVDTVVGGTVDGGACDRLAQSSGVPIAQSGAVRTGEEITPLFTPNNALQSFEVTQGMLSLIASNGAVASPIDTSGIWVSTDVARDFGLTVGSTLATDHGNATVAGVYPWPNDGRDTRFAYAFLVPRAAVLGDYNECWIRQWPRSEPASNLLYSTLRVGNGQNQAGVVALNKGFDAHYDPYATYMARTTRWIPFLAALLGLAIGVIARAHRRLRCAHGRRGHRVGHRDRMPYPTGVAVRRGACSARQWPVRAAVAIVPPLQTPVNRTYGPGCDAGPRPALDSVLDTGADAHGASAERGPASTD